MHTHSHAHAAGGRVEGKKPASGKLDSNPVPWEPAPWEPLAESVNRHHEWGKKTIDFFQLKLFALNVTKFRAQARICPCFLVRV